MEAAVIKLQPKNFALDDDICIADIKTSEDAVELRARLTVDSIWIEDQLSAADEFYDKNGYHEDPDWFRRAKTALRFKKFGMQRLQEHGAKLAKLEREKKSERYQDRLVANLRKHVGETVFMQIVDETINQVKGE